MVIGYAAPMAETPRAPAHIRTLPSWLLGRAAARGHRLVGEALARVGLRMMHHAVLSAVAESGPLSQAELGRGLGIDRKDMVAILDDLQGEGLVTRAPDVTDRRKNAVAVTASGRRLLRRAVRLGDAANDELTAALSPAERAQLVDLLTRIVQPGEPCAAPPHGGR